MTKFKKTRWMNLIGGWGLVLSGVALFISKLGNTSIGVLVGIVLLYGIMAMTALGTAQALKENSSKKHRVIATWLNWLLVGIYALGVVVVVLGTFAAPDVMKRMLAALMSGSLALVVPELINIRALRSIRATSNEQA